MSTTNEYRFVMCWDSDPDDLDLSGLNGHYFRGRTPKEALEWGSKNNPPPEGCHYRLDKREVPWREGLPVWS